MTPTSSRSPDITVRLRCWSTAGNNDARPDENWISEAVATFESSTSIGAVESKVLDWDGVNVEYLDAAITWYGMSYKPHAGE